MPPSFLENSLVRLGHRFPSHRLAASLCFRYGARLSARGGELDRWARLSGGGEIHLPLDDHTFRALYFHGVYDEDLYRLLARIARPGQVWLDLGANIGVYTLRLSRCVGAVGAVHAFEPNPDLLRHLRLTVDRNRLANVRLHACALGETAGMADFYLPLHAGHAEGGSARGSLLPQRDIPHRRLIRVPVTTLDEALREEPRPIFGMKIDIEGYEAAMLDGARRFFAERPPEVVLSEVTHRPDALLAPAALIARFAALGYRAWRLDPLRPYRSGDALDPVRDGNILFARGPAALTGLSG